MNMLILDQLLWWTFLCILEWCCIFFPNLFGFWPFCVDWDKSGQYLRWKLFKCNFSCSHVFYIFGKCMWIWEVQTFFFFFVTHYFINCRNPINMPFFFFVNKDFQNYNHIVTWFFIFVYHLEYHVFYRFTIKLATLTSFVLVLVI